MEYKGEMMIGQYVDGEMQGPGIFQMRNGSWWEGPFKDDSPHGSGVLHRVDGTTERVDFKNGKKVREINLDN